MNFYNWMSLLFGILAIICMAFALSVFDTYPTNWCRFILGLGMTACLAKIATNYERIAKELSESEDEDEAESEQQLFDDEFKEDDNAPEFTGCCAGVIVVVLIFAVIFCIGMYSLIKCIF